MTSWIVDRASYCASESASHEAAKGSPIYHLAPHLGSLLRTSPTHHQYPYSSLFPTVVAALFNHRKINDTILIRVGYKNTIWVESILSSDYRIAAYLPYVGSECSISNQWCCWSSNTTSKHRLYTSIYWVPAGSWVQSRGSVSCIHMCIAWHKVA